MKDVVIRIKTDDDIQPTLDKLVQLGKVDKQNAETFKKANDQFKVAQEKRGKMLQEEIEDLKEIQRASKLAFSPEEIKEYNKRIKETQSRIKLLKGETEATTSSFERASSAVKKLGGILAGAFIVQKITSLASQARELAAKTEGVERAFRELNKPNLLNELRNATRGTVSDLNLMQAAVRAENFKIPLEQMGKFLNFAQVRARQTGESVDYLVNSIVTGIGRNSPKILDNLGISIVEIRQEMKKTGDMATAIGNIIDREMSKVGDKSLTAADKANRLNASFENIQVLIGKTLIESGSGFIGVLGEMAEGFEDLLKQPVSEKMDEERIALNMLVQQITSTNENQEERNRLIGELQDKYPDFLANIKQEEINNELLTTRLKEVNEQLINRIIIQRKQEEIDEVNEKIAERKIRDREIEQNILRKLIEASEDYNFELLKEGTIAEKVLDAQQKLAKQFKDETGPAFDGAQQAVKGLAFEMGQLNKPLTTMGQLEGELNKLLSDKDALMKELGITLENTAGKTKKNTGINNDAKTAVELLAEEIKTLKVELENQALAGEISNETMAEYVKLLDKAEAAAVKLKKAEMLRRAEINGTLDEALNTSPKEAPLPVDPAADAIKKAKETEEKIREEQEKTHNKRIENLIEESNLENEKRIKKAKATEEEMRAIKERERELQVEIILELSNLAMELSNRQAQSKLEALDEQYNIELAKLEDQYEKRTISEQQFGDLRRSIESELDEEKKAILTQQAKIEKAVAVFSAIINTAKAVVVALASAPPPANFLLAKLTAGLGAVQIATILAQPIPAFRLGGTSQGGVALVGEEGPELVNLPKGAQVKTASQTSGTMDEIFSQLTRVNEAIKLLIENDENLLLAAFTRGLLGTFATRANIETLKAFGFAEGTDYVKGGTPGKDSVAAMLMPGEAVIKSKENAKYPGMAKAWNEGTFENFINTNYVAPLVIKGNIKQAQEEESYRKMWGMGSGNGFDDFNIVRKLEKNNKIQREILEQLKRSPNIGNHRVK